MVTVKEAASSLFPPKGDVAQRQGGHIKWVAGCAAEARPVDETAEAEQGPRSVFCEGAATPEAKAGHRNPGGFDHNNAGASLYSRPPQRDPIFRDAKVLLFWCDQQQKEHWLDIPFCCHIGWVFTRACKRSLGICRPLTSNTVWCPVFVISTIN